MKYEFLCEINARAASKAVAEIEDGITKHMQEMTQGNERVVIRCKIPSILTGSRELTPEEQKKVSDIMEEAGGDINLKVISVKRMEGGE